MTTLQLVALIENIPPNIKK